MGIRMKGLLMACVAAIIVLGLIYGPDLFGVDSPKVEEKSSTKPVYPERGYTELIATGADGQPFCGESNDTVKTSDVASTELADNGGTVSDNGLLVSSKWTDDSVVVTFSGGIPPFSSGYVIGSEGSEPFNMPEVKAGERLTGITLDTKDFSESGTFKDIVLCGGGL